MCSTCGEGFGDGAAIDADSANQHELSAQHLKQQHERALPVAAIAKKDITGAWDCSCGKSFGDGKQISRSHVDQHQISAQHKEYENSKKISHTIRSSDSTRKRRRSGATVIVRPRRCAEEQKERELEERQDESTEWSSEEEEGNEGSSSEEEEEEDEEEDQISDSHEDTQGSRSNERGRQQPAEDDSGENDDDMQEEGGETEQMKGAPLPPPARSRSGRAQVAKKRFPLEG